MLLTPENVWFNCFLFISKSLTMCCFLLSLLGRETNLKFKMGLRVTDERLQEERQLAAFNGGCCSLEQVTFICN